MEKASPTLHSRSTIRIPTSTTLTDNTHTQQPSFSSSSSSTSSSSLSSRVTRDWNWSRVTLWLQRLWLYRYQYLFGHMDQFEHKHQMHTNALGVNLSSSSPDDPDVDDLSTAHLSCSCCWVRSSAFDGVVIANHLYLVISFGYLCLNLMRITFSPSADFIVFNHFSFLVFSDTFLLILASLFVVDAALFAYVHACSVMASLEMEAERRMETIDFNDMHHSGGSGDNDAEDETVSLMKPSASADHTPSRSTTPISILDSPTTMSTASASSTPGAPHLTPVSSSSPASSYPTLAYRNNSYMMSASPSSPSKSPRGRVLSMRVLVTAFFTSAEGIAEMLNVVGGIGYLITAILPFVYFIVSETTERSLDRAANVIDNLSMLVFVVDSWLYLWLWQRRPPGPLQEFEQSIDARERQTLININGGHAATTGAAAPPPVSTADKSSSQSSSSSSGSGVKSSGTRLTAAGFPCRNSNNDNNNSDTRSVCDRREYDAYLWGNVCNILAGVFYLASTIYGFTVRVQANEDLASIRLLAQNMDAADQTGQLSPHHRADALLNSLVESSSSLLQTASSLLHADPSYTSWEAEIEMQFKTQMSVAFLGDIFYFLCAISMEVAYYSTIRRQRQQAKHDRFESTQQQQYQQRHQHHHQMQMKHDRSGSGFEVEMSRINDQQAQQLHGTPQAWGAPPSMAAAASARQRAREEQDGIAGSTLVASSTAASSAASTPVGAPPSIADGLVYANPLLVVLDRNDPALSLSPNSPPYLLST